MKVGPVATVEKRNKTTSTKVDFDVMLENYDVIPFFKFKANLEQYRSRIPDA